jgi:hypothetical protein
MKAACPPMWNDSAIGGDADIDTAEAGPRRRAARR